MILRLGSQAEGQLAPVRSIQRSGGAGPFTQAVTGLVNGATYSFSVWAVNGDGRGPAATATGKAMPTITLSATGTLTEVVETPTDDSVTASVTLSNTSIEDISITVYEVVDDGNRPQVTITNGTIVIPSGQTAGPDSATIRAINDAVDDDDANARIQVRSEGATAPADTASIDITDDDEVPGAPRSLTATAGDKKLTVEWISPDDNGSSPITHYEYRHTTTTFDGDKGWKMVTGGPGARTVTIGNLTNDTAVNVEVRAVSAAGPGDSANGSGTPTG